MSKQGKVWGATTEFFKNDHVSAHFLAINKGGYCSEHKHDHKSNLFFVMSGDLEITIWTPLGTLDVTTLREGESTEVPPGVFHKFRALSDVRCIEVYQVKLGEPDIERRSVGGKD